MSNPVSMMAAFANQLYQLMESDSRIHVMTADLVGSCALKNIEKSYADRFINVGIAEQNMVSIAAGLAAGGMLPFTYTFAAFHSMRACEQVRTDVFYNGLNVKVVGTHSGVSTGQAGSTHFALEDIGIIRSMPKSTIVIPSDPVSAAKTAELMYQYPKGAYIRLDRNPLPELYTAEESFSVGKAHVLKDGTDIVLFAVGIAVHAALYAASIIESCTGKSVAVVDIYSVKPLDQECVIHYAKTCSAAFTIEEHNTCCGLFGAIAECLIQQEKACPVYPLGVQDDYPHGNTLDRARERIGIDTKGIVNTVCAKIQ